MELEPEPSQSRKRLRSSSMQSSGSSSSNKRAASDPLVENKDQDIDDYMASQGDQDDADSVQRRFALLEDYVKRPLTIGQTWYLVSKRWHRKWLQAHDPASKERLDPAQLGPVDNSDLFTDADKTQLRRPLLEDVDMVPVPEEAWSMLESWYGKAPIAIPRKVIGRGVAKTPVIEYYPKHVHVHRIVKTEAEGVDNPRITMSVSESTTLRDFCEMAFKAFAPEGSHQNNTPYRIWSLAPAEDTILGVWKATVPTSELDALELNIVEASDKTFAETTWSDDDVFLVEFKADDGWLVNNPGRESVIGPRPESPPDYNFRTGGTFLDNLGKADSSNSTAVIPASASTRSNFFGSKTSRTISQAVEPGTLGLGNLGNTCFMNSALQCLAHTQELTEYFLAGVFEKELNPDNPLGMQGAIAQAYGALISRIWSPTSSTGSSYSPREFKTQLARFAPQFSGYQQHDSQELVAFLLDGLHEDLNRVLKKPYVEKPDWPDNISPADHDRELAKFAKTSWDGYKLRNDSVIVDLFQGQYQSTLVCPECNKVSITFDPFMYLTLPLPVTKKWYHDIFFVPWEDDRPHLKIPVVLKSTASFKELRQLLGRWTYTPPENLLTMEIWSGRFYKNLDDNVAVGDVSSGDIVVCYQLPCHAQQSRTYKRKEGDPFVLPVHLTDEAGSKYGSGNFSRMNSHNFGYPTVAVVTEEESRDPKLIYEAMVRRLARWTTMARDLFRWQIGDGVDEVQEVKLNGLPPVDGITEIHESGDVVTVQEGGLEQPSEEDIVDEKGIMLADESDETIKASQFNGEIRLVGPKPDIFTLKLVANNADFGTSSYYSSTVTRATLEQRAEEATQANPSLLRENDSFNLEFDVNMKDYYFSDEHATWDPKFFEESLHPEYKAAVAANKDDGKKDISLQDCLDEFTREEQLGEDDLWYCPRCKKHQQATKKFDLWKVPDILVVHLKRFSNNRIIRDKIDALVDFPTHDLDLTSVTGERLVGKRLSESGEDLSELGISSDEFDEDLRYDLFAVDEHLGGLGGGHYRAYASNHMNGKWYHFDDSYVTPSEAERSVNANAYLLFYRRRGARHLGGVSWTRTQEAKEAAREASDDAMDTSLDSSARTDTSSNWVSISQQDYPPSTSHPSLSIADNPALTSLSNEEWRQHLSSSNVSNTGSSGMSTPPSEDLDDFSHPDPLAAATSKYDNSTSSFSFPDPSNSSPASSTGVEVDSDRDIDSDWHSGNSNSAYKVKVTSPNASPKWTTGSEHSSRSDFSEPLDVREDLDDSLEKAA